MKMHLAPKTVVLVCVILGIIVAIPAFAQQPIKLKFAHFMPPTTRQAQLAEQWCREVEKRTNNKVKINSILVPPSCPLLRPMMALSKVLRT